jgi:hypothetical protein
MSCKATIMATVFVIEFHAEIYSASGCFVTSSITAPNTRNMIVAFLKPELISESPQIRTADNAKLMIQCGIIG